MPVTAHPASQREIDPADLPLALRASRFGFRALRLVSRRAAARLAGHFFVRPRRHPVPRRESELTARGRRADVTYRDKRIAVWTWGADDAERGTAILVHGWEGRGAQLGAFVDPLVERGFRVVAFDHVAHGESDGKRCALPTMRDTLRIVAQESIPGGVEPAAIVAHSMGSFATSLLLADGWRDTRCVYVSPPADLMVYFSHYLDLVTGSDDLLPLIVRQLERRFGEKLEDFRFERLVETLTQPLLVLHSRDDTDVPVERGRLVAEHWPGARMVEVEGLGHRRILRDDRVVEEGVSFLADGVNTVEASP